MDIQNKTITNLNKELGQVVDMNEIKEKLKKHFSKLFECNTI